MGARPERKKERKNTPLGVDGGSRRGWAALREGHAHQLPWEHAQPSNKQQQDNRKHALGTHCVHQVMAVTVTSNTVRTAHSSCSAVLVTREAPAGGGAAARASPAAAEGPPSPLPGWPGGERVSKVTPKAVVPARAEGGRRRKGKHWGCEFACACVPRHYRPPPRTTALHPQHSTHSTHPRRPWSAAPRCATRRPLRRRLPRRSAKRRAARRRRP